MAIVTVGEEVLAGDTTNTNASWSADRITSRGPSVQRILTIPDNKELIAETVKDWSDSFDAVVITGGLGGTHDDVTLEAVASAFDRAIVTDEKVLEEAKQKVAEYRKERWQRSFQKYRRNSTSPSGVTPRRQPITRSRFRERIERKSKRQVTI